MVLGNGSILLDFRLGMGVAEHLFSYLLEYLNKRGFKVVGMLGCGSFGAVMLAE